jgi:hypothetical protein
MEVDGQIKAQAALFPWKQPRHPLERMMIKPQFQSDLYEEEDMSVLPCQESKLDSSVVQPSHYID